MAVRLGKAGHLSGLRGRVKRAPSLRDQVYGRLRAAILSGEMRPGSAVIEVDVAERLGASRTPVREALRRLESEGLLEPRGGRGSVVRVLKRDDVECIFEIREALETLAARRAARRLDAAGFGELDRLVQRMHECCDDPAEMERLDTAFHDKILAYTDGARLQRMLGDLRSDILPWRFRALATLERRRAVVDEHAAMLAAMKSGDDAAIIEATSRHLVNSREGISSDQD
jgi:DNA-binding GntR family transcriptional regulator